MRKIVSLILTVIIISALFSGCVVSVETNFEYENSDKYTMGSATIDGKVKKVDIGWCDGKIDIEYSFSIDNVVFYEKSATNTNETNTLYHWLEDDGTLHIMFCKSGNHKFQDYKKDLTVIIPNYIELEEININSVTSDISIKGENNGVELLQVRTVAGDNLDVTMNKIDSLNISVVSENVDVKLAQTPEDVNIDTVSGNIRFSVPSDSKFIVEYDTVSGGFDCDFANVKQGDRRIINNGEAVYKFNTVSGNLVVTSNS